LRIFHDHLRKSLILYYSYIDDLLYIKDLAVSTFRYENLRTQEDHH
jgi:hypothetical protein